MSNLDEAKISLKKALSRLENVVEKNLSSISGNQNKDLEKSLGELKKNNEILQIKLKEQEEEMSYLRERNHELQAKVGLEQEKSIKLHNKNTEAARRIDEIIGDVNSYFNQ